MADYTFKECVNCPGDKCLHLGLRCNHIPVLDPKLRSLLEWKRIVCSKTKMEYNHGAIICRLNEVIVHTKGSWDIGCKGCPYES